MYKTSPMDEFVTRWHMITHAYKRWKYF